MKKIYVFKILALLFPIILFLYIDVIETSILVSYAIIFYIGLMWLDIEFNDLLKSRIFYNLSLLLPFYLFMLAFNIFLVLT